jgi:hypothetical protein
MIYHRRESPTQTPEDALKQVESLELWGHESRYGGPSVRAYVGPLPLGVRGIEFRTDCPPDHGSPPSKASWTPSRPGVRLEHGIAKLRVLEIVNRQENVQ